MRTAALALIAASIAVPAAAQSVVTNADQHLENRVWGEQQLQQQQALAAQREAYAAQQRAQAAATVADIQARTAAMQATAPEPLNPDLAAADEAIARAQARFLADSNARILAVTGGAASPDPRSLPELQGAGPCAGRADAHPETSKTAGAWAPRTSAAWGSAAWCWR
jgi:hypothetical protein